jgi:hypothetical protein
LTAGVDQANSSCPAGQSWTEGLIDLDRGADELVVLGRETSDAGRPTAANRSRCTSEALRSTIESYG